MASSADLNPFSDGTMRPRTHGTAAVDEKSMMTGEGRISVFVWTTRI